VVVCCEFETHRLLPESVVWLCANNRVAEAERIIGNAAQLNNVTMPDKILAHPDTTDHRKGDDRDRTKGGKLLEKFGCWCNWKRSRKVDDGNARYTLLDVFRHRRLTVNIACIVPLWSVTLLFAISIR